MLGNDIPIHKKKKASSASDAKSKSNHKHQYEERLLVAQGKPRRAKCCALCGKVGNVIFFDFVKTESGFHRQLHDEEIYRKYHRLEIIEVQDFYQKYIPATTNDADDY